MLPLQAPELLVSLLKAAGENGPFILVGHSMGGGLVQVLAAKNSGEQAALLLSHAVCTKMRALHTAVSI